MKSKGTLVTLDFTPLTLENWRDYFARVPRTTLTQSYDYARAVAASSVLRPRHALIRVHGDVVGLMQVMEARAFRGALHAVILDRGPLWLTAHPDPAWIHGFLVEFNQIYPRRLGRRRRVMLECPIEQIDDQSMQQLGYKRRSRLLPYQTDWLDLTRDIDVLRAALDRKWRNILTRAERDDVVRLGLYTDPRAGKEILIHALRDQKIRGYRGLDTRSLMRLVHTAAQGDGILMAEARIKTELGAGAIFIRHGTCATWQSGFVNAAGRTHAANYILLWQAILYLKEMGVRALDLGGMNDQDAKGIGHFKKGLGGEHVTLRGTFY